MAEENKKTEELAKAKVVSKPAEAASAMPDGSDKSDHIPTGPEQAIAAAETPAEAAAAPVEEKLRSRRSKTRSRSKSTS